MGEVILSFLLMLSDRPSLLIGSVKGEGGGRTWLGCMILSMNKRRTQDVRQRV